LLLILVVVEGELPPRLPGRIAKVSPLQIHSRSASSCIGRRLP
jgi:hypothetical protein